ncbi:MAG: sugar kinase [Clostridia bacterium]|nr:sugar kinase [Clostridia bacterium]
MINHIKDKEFSVLGIGEVMLRLSPVGKERISYSEAFEKKAGGSELNVVSGISMLGLRTGIITKLPGNEIGKFIKHKIRYSGTSDDYITYDYSPAARLGIYYYESGAYPRQSVVSYDRRGSAFTTFSPSELPESIYSSANLFHTSGITLALDKRLRGGVLEMMERFKREGTLISFDVNYRAALWDEADAKAAVLEVLPLVDVLFISEETSRKMLGMKGSLKEIHRALSEKYQGLEIIASTKRRPITPNKHDFSSLVYDCKEKLHYSEPEYRKIDVVDRIGSGDAYVAGAIFALLKFRSVEKMASYGNAMAALKNTIPGDTAQCDLADVERTIKNHTEKSSASEMVR